MKITKVCCQGCGADLKVDESVRYVTCNYCHARLEVVHDTSVTHTRILEKLEKNTERMAGNLRVIELQNDLERLDREWEVQKESYMVSGKNGARYIPSVPMSIVTGVLVIGVGIFMLNIASSFRGEATMPTLMGVVAMGFGLYTSISGCSKAMAHESAEEDFRLRRDALVRQIDEARRR